MSRTHLRNITPKSPKPVNLARIYRSSRVGRARIPLYIARFEGGELDGRQQAMYGRARSFPWPHINKALWWRPFGFGPLIRKSDYYVCTTPNKRVETMGETRVYRNEPHFELPLE